MTRRITSVRRITAGILAVCLFLFAGVSAFAATPYKTATIGTVNLGNNAQVTVTNAELVDSLQGRALVYTVRFVNNGNVALDLSDYWFRVKSSDGASFKVANADGNAVSSVPPKSSRVMTFVSEVERTTTLQSLRLEVIKWDFSTSSYERVMGQIQFPADYSNITPFNRTQEFRWKDQLIYTKLTSAIEVKDSESRTVGLTWVLVNGGYQPIRMSGTNFMIVTKSGAAYQADYDASISEIPAKAQKTFQLSATVPNGVSLDQARLVWYEQKDNVKYPLPIVSHEIVLSSEEAQTAAVLKLQINNQTVESRSSEIGLVTKGDQLNQLMIRYQFLNKGTVSVSLPKLVFEYQTSAGITYPLEAEGSVEGMVIKPGVPGEVTLKTDLPVDAGISRGAILVYEMKQIGGAERKILLGKHADTSAGQPQSNALKFDQTAAYTNTKGKYGVKVGTLQRNPWNTEDIIQAEVVIENQDNQSSNLPVPSLAADIYLDGVLLNQPVQLVAHDEVFNLGKDEQAKYTLYTKVGYNTKFNAIKVVIKEKVNESFVTMASFEGSSQQITASKTYATNAAIDSSNRKNPSSITVRNLYVFEGATTDMVAAEVVLSNGARRVSGLPQWTGYFRNKNGLVFPAVIEQTNGAVNPNGKVVTYAYATIPKNVGFTDFELIIGEAVNNQNYTNVGEPATSYIGRAVVDVGKVGNKVGNNFDSIEIAPYNLSMSNVLAALFDERRFTLTFNYDLLWTSDAEQSMIKRTLLLQLKDDNGKVFEQTVVLDSTDANGLQRGRGLRKEIVFEDSNLFMSVPVFKGYVLNIYEVVNNHNRLLASKNMEWFVRS